MINEYRSALAYYCDTSGAREGCLLIVSLHLDTAEVLCHKLSPDEKNGNPT